MAELFVLDELAALLDQDIPTARAQVIRRIASAKVLAVCGRIPDPVPDDLAAVGLELSARLFTNTEGLLSESIGGYYRSFPGLVTMTEDEKRTCRRYRSALAYQTTVGYPVG